jgi:hypothetical protein
MSEEKKIDRSSEAFTEGYKEAFIERDAISHVFSTFVPHSDDFNAGKEEGERDKTKSDYEKNK